MEFAETVEPGALAVALSEDHGHRLWMLRRAHDPYAPAGYADLVPLGRALVVGLNPLLSEELPMDMGSRQAVARARSRGMEHVGFASLFTRRTASRDALLNRGDDLNHPDAAATMVRALDWLVDGPGSASRMLVAAWGPPPAPSGAFRARMLERIRWLTDLAAARDLAIRGYMSTGDRWPCSTDRYGKTPGDFRWLSAAD